jgi:hypothetical protein
LDGVVEPPLALHELFDGVAELPPEPDALQLALPPLAPAAAADGSGVAGTAGAPPQPTIVPISIPAIAETVRVFPMFIFPLLTLANPKKGSTCRTPFNRR